MRIFFRLLKLVSPYRWWMLLAAFIGFLTIGSSIGLMMTSAYIIAKAALHPSIAELQIAIVGVRFFGISRGVFRYLERLVSHSTTFRLLAKFRVWFYQKLQPIAPAGLQNHNSGDLLARIITDIESLENFFLRVLYPPLVAFLISLLTLVLYGQISWMLAGIVFCSMMLTGLLIPLFTVQHSKKLGAELVRTRADLTRTTIEYIQGLPDLMVFGRAQEWRQKIIQLENMLNAQVQKFARIESFYQALLGLIMHLTIFLLLYLAAPMVSAGLLDGVFLSVLALGVMSAFEAINPLPQSAQFWQENKSAAARLFDVAAYPSTKITTAENINESGIVFQHVHFSYDEIPVLHDVNLTIQPGEKIAVVGASGSGKSTLANLLLGFWQPQNGHVFVNGVDVAAQTQQTLAEKIVLVPQNPYLFSGTVQENLQLANPHATDAAFASACRQVKFDAVVQNLPQQLQTWIGEQGTRLSGGEQQRLALAQGLSRVADFYIFDEPTANLDPQLERAVFNALYNVPGTVIIITHRLIELEKANRIIVMQQGKIAEMGTFAQLASQGILSEMLQIQNEGLKNDI